MHEKSLDFALQYEKAIGGGPNVHRLKARAYENLDRDAEAAKAWKQYLKGDPKNLLVMRSLGRLLKPNDLDWLSEHVAKLDNSDDTATTLSEYFIHYQNDEVTAVMLKLLKKNDPQSARIAYLKGRQFENDEWYEEAAGQYRQAFQAAKDDEQLSEYVQYFLNAMFHAERTLDGYAAAPDAREAFRYLAGGSEDGDLELPDNVMQALLDAHRQRDSKDPWIRYYSGRRLLDKKKYEQAFREFDAGLKAVNDDVDRESFSYQRKIALALAGRAIAAYEESDSKADSFRYIASTLRYGDRFEDLASLVERRRTDQADDEWTDYYAAIVLAEKNQHRQADELLARASQRATDETFKRQVLYLRLGLRLKSGYRVLDCWDVEPVDATFGYLASEFTRRHRWQELDKLLRDYATRRPESFDWLERQIDFDWAMRDYQQLIGRLTPWPDALLKDVAEWQLTDLRTRLVRSQLRMGQKREAAADVAESDWPETQNRIAAILVAAVNRDVDEVMRLFAEHERSNSAPSYLYDDEDIGMILQSEPFLRLRKKFPPNLNVSVADTAVVILLKHPSDANADQFAANLSQKFDVTQSLVELTLHPTTSLEKRFLVSIENHRYCIALGNSRYEDPDEPAADRISDVGLKDHVEKHTGWISINDFSEGNEFDRSNWARTCKIAAALCDDNALALQFSGLNRLLAVTDATLAAIQDDKQRDLRIDSGENVWMYRKTENPEREREARKQRRRLREFEQKFKQRQPDQKFLMYVEINVAGITEELSVRLTEIRKSRYGSSNYVGELTSDSALVPRLRQGEIASVWRNDIIGLKFP